MRTGVIDVDEFSSLLAALNESDAGKQEAAAAQLETNKHTPQQGLALIAAAARTYPNDENRKYETIGARLLKPCWNDPDDVFVPAIVEHYGDLCRDEQKHWQLLRILTELATKESLQVFVDLLSRPASKPIDLELPLAPLIGSFWGGREPVPEMAALFPRWFDLVDHLDDVYHVYSVISKCQDGGVIDYSDYPNFVTASVFRAKRTLETISSCGVSPTDSQSSKSLARAKTELEWILDLFGEMHHAEIPEILRQCLDSTVDQVKLFAIVSALKHHIPVSTSTLRALAVSPTNRHRLWRLLDYSGHLDRFPAKYRTNRMLAEANMVRWLEFPTEMGRPPEEIEPLTVIRLRDANDEPCEAYFFKFRHPDFLGGEWFVGFGGTYRIHDTPKLTGDGTFSRFDALESKSIEDHVATYLSDETEG